MHKTNRILLLTLVAATIQFSLQQAFAEVPPAPPGFQNRNEARSAFLRGKMKIIDLKLRVPDNLNVQKGIVYGKGGEFALKLDLYTPKKIDKNLPGVIFFHGGGWKMGSREIYHYDCVKLAEHGYVVATASYRLIGKGTFPAAIEDAKCAVRWMRANAAKLHVNPNRIAVAGGSAGAHLAMMVGYSVSPELEGKGGYPNVSSRVQAVIDLYGPIDLTAPAAVQNSMVVNFMGKSFKEAPDSYKLASPLFHITKDDPPTLILHGSIDRIVPITQSELLAKNLKKQGIPYEYDRIEGWPHSMDIAEKVNAHCLGKMYGFLDQHLKSPKASEQN